MILFFGQFSLHLGYNYSPKGTNQMAEKCNSYIFLVRENEENGEQQESDEGEGERSRLSQLSGCMRAV